ncbi:MAG: c-type cytochrome [Adhaeribacter sp.]
MGRIYRVVHEKIKTDQQRPNMLNETTAQLVAHLNHPNGWWRDNAQQLLIVRKDLNVVGELQKMVAGEKVAGISKPGHLARIHALWTLEGLEALDKATLYKALADTDPQVRKTAVWASEGLIRKNDAELIARLGGMQQDPSADVRIQLALSLRENSTAPAKAIVASLLAANQNNELMQYSFKTFAESQKTLAAEREQTRNLSPAHRELVTKGATIFKQLCSNCHGADGRGRDLGDGKLPAPPLAGSPRVKGDKVLLTQLMLNGLKGPVDGVTYTDMMPAMGHNSDEWLAAVMSYIRNSSELGNKASVMTPEEVKLIRSKTPKIPGGMTLQMLEIFKLGRNENTNWSK